MLHNIPMTTRATRAMATRATALPQWRRNGAMLSLGRTSSDKIYLSVRRKSSSRLPHAQSTSHGRRRCHGLQLVMLDKGLLINSQSNSQSHNGIHPLGKLKLTHRKRLLVPIG